MKLSAAQRKVLDEIDGWGPTTDTSLAFQGYRPQTVASLVQRGFVSMHIRYDLTPEGRAALEESGDG